MGGKEEKKVSLGESEGVLRNKFISSSSEEQRRDAVTVRVKQRTKCTVQIFQIVSVSLLGLRHSGDSCSAENSTHPNLSFSA